MTALHYLLTVGFCYLFCPPSFALAHQSKVGEDILTGGVSEPLSSSSNPLLAHIHIRGGSSGSLNTIESRTQHSSHVPSQQAYQENLRSLAEKNNKVEGFSALQTSGESDECSCTFAGLCLYKGACLWIAASLSLGVLVAIFLMAWALQWMVAIPAEWVLGKKQLREALSKAKTSDPSPADSAPLLGDS
ncbi:uncharacterized protein LOC34618035 [Cyclospora cayetanensis]|uniref:Uncharacterized protein LOC34618035 n=2 Tax=Cyclospora cayetanensis TaxID=88456 RepID=A0A6P5WCJ2_9EIME|nr:uncharacterized protein LOC34618035 [Cyclospora cayetanensis]OEH74738.1 hypothetical protein cyc_00944 [Cyclospora cayetanensis]